MCLCIESLFKCCGFVSKGLFVMDGSWCSVYGNVYFSGFGVIKCIVFFDMLFVWFNLFEMEVVFVYEFGYFKCYYIIKCIVVMFVLSLGVLVFFGWFMMCIWFYLGFGVVFNLFFDNYVLVLMLFFLVLLVFMFFVLLLVSLLLCKDEYEVDVFVVEYVDVN